MKSDSPLHVAVGVIRDIQGNILITRRPEHVHQGGLWEFPGGKLEAGESVQHALRRELLEEVGIRVDAAQPLIKVRHDYGDRRVVLDVWNVSAYSGKETACEGQAMRWVTQQQLCEFPFPAANLQIIKAVQLPGYYAILEGRSIEEVLINCDKILLGGVKLMQFRVKSLVQSDVHKVFPLVLKKCRQQQVRLLVNSDLAIPAGLATDGIHLSSRSLSVSRSRPEGYAYVGASCHNLLELQLAEKLGLDFAVLAPVQDTPTHPGVISLGWEGFTALLEQVNLPVYALGGLRLDDYESALKSGAQGVAGISAFLRQD